VVFIYLAYYKLN